jgi:hypothetical protein
MWNARARRGRPARAAALLVLAGVLAACNPYTATGRLPPARCQIDADCTGGGSCVGGLCARAGWAAGHLRYADPSRPDPGALRLVVTAADLTGAGILPRSVPRGDAILAEAPGSDRFKIEGLPRGRLALLALCRDNGRAAGLAPFVIDDRRGYRPGMGLARDEEIELAVNLANCGE